jgi:hypothetical protein
MKILLRTLPLALIASTACAPLGAAREDVPAETAGFRLQPGIIVCANVIFGEQFWDRAKQVSPQSGKARFDFTLGLLGELVPILEPHLKGKHLRPGQPAIDGVPVIPKYPHCPKGDSVLRVKVTYMLDETASLLSVHYIIDQGGLHKESRRVLNREEIWKSGRYASGYGRDPWLHTLSRDMEISAQHIADLILDGE